MPRCAQRRHRQLGRGPGSVAWHVHGSSCKAGHIRCPSHPPHEGNVGIQAGKGATAGARQGLAERHRWALPRHHCLSNLQQVGCELCILAVQMCYIRSARLGTSVASAPGGDPQPLPLP